ncbi:MAG: pitrilysin family protein [Gemmatimonadaceae bacterium]
MRTAPAALATLAALALSGCAGTRPSPPPAARQAPAAMQPPAARFMSPVEYHKLPNGLRVVLSRDTSTPLARVGVYYDVGSRQEPRGRSGFAHLFEHLMFEGSEHLRPGEFTELITSNGGIREGSTQFDFTRYPSRVPSHVLELVLWAEADRMRALELDPKRLAVQRDVVKNEVRQNADDQAYGRFVWSDMPSLAQTKWENQHDVYGDMATLDAASLDDARQFYRTYYAPNNAALAIYGDFEPAQALAWVRKYFGDIPSAPRPPRADLREPRQTEEKRVAHTDARAARPALAIAYHMPPRNSREFWVMGVIDQLLLQGRDSWLAEAVVQRRGLAAAVYGGVSARHGNLYTVNGESFWTPYLFHDAAQSPDSILATIDAEIERLRAAPVDQATLARAVIKARSDFHFQANTNVGIGRVDLLGTLALFDDDPARINRIEDEFRAVTPELLHATAREYLRPTNRTVLFLHAGAAPAPAP